MRKGGTLSSTRFSALRQLLKVQCPEAFSREQYFSTDVCCMIEPYLVHGIVSAEEILGIWNARLGFTLKDHLCQEILRQSYARHCWQYRGEGVLGDACRRPGLIGYQSRIPVDIRSAACGISSIDTAIRQMYQAGRIDRTQQHWIASYMVHMRKIDWRIGARWMYGHLLNADLGAIHLDWQKTAGALGEPARIFTAAAMGIPEAGCGKHVNELDCEPSELQALACKAKILPSEKLRPLPLREPCLHENPEQAGFSHEKALPSLLDKDVSLIHPWSLGQTAKSRLSIGLIHLPYHRRFPWSEQRWRFVMERMRSLCNGIWVGDLAHDPDWLSEARSVDYADTLHSEYHSALERIKVARTMKSKDILGPDYPCASFEIYFQTVQRQYPKWQKSPLHGQVARLRRRR